MMKRISPALFLTLASWMVADGHILLAQESYLDLAPGPIAELLPDDIAPFQRGLIGDNPLPPAGSGSRQPVAPPTDSATDSTPVVTPPRTSVRSTPPTMPSEVWSAPRTPRSILNTNSTASQPTVYPHTPNTDFSTQETIVGTEFVGDCGCEQVQDSCNTCDEPCDTCESGKEVVYVRDATCDGECEVTESREPRRAKKEAREPLFARLHSKKAAKRSAADTEPNNYVDDNYVDDGYVDEDDYIDDGYADCADGQCAVAPIDYGQQDQSGVNTLLGVSGLYFQRNYGDNQQLSASRFAGERGLFSNDADHDDFGGIDANLIRRRANGTGYEVRYFGFSPSNATATLGGNPFTTVAASNFGPDFGLSGVGVPGQLTAAEAFNLAEVHQVTRETTIHNAEFNFLRMGRTPDRARRGDDSRINFEYLAGFRYFKFDESLNYSALAIRPVAATGNGNLLRADYKNEVSNDLYGIQIGGRSEIGLGRKFSLIIGTKAGIFSNHFSNQQNVSFLERNGNRITNQVLSDPSDPNQGAAFDTDGDDTDITMLGELDLGLTYHLFKNSRLRVGYKAIFVSDVAFAADQTEFFFQDLNAVQQPEANDDLVLHGGYFGMEFAF